MTQLYQRELNSVNTLYDAGARLFRLTDENRPAESRGFYDRQLSLDDLLEHLKRRGRLGIEPRSIGAVVVDIDDGDPDRFTQAFSPLSLCKSKTEGRCHAYYRHEGFRVSPQPFDAPVFGIKGDLKYKRSYVALYDTERLANDITNGNLGVPFIEVEQALVTGPLAAQGGQRGPSTPPVGSTTPAIRPPLRGTTDITGFDESSRRRAWMGCKGRSYVAMPTSSTPVLFRLPDWCRITLS